MHVRATLAFLFASVAALAGPTAAPSADALHDAAQAEYQAKKYKAACPHFQRAAELAPERGEYWSDAGVCWPHLKKKAEALAADRKAAQSASEAARKSAYFNLSRAGAAVDWAAWEKLEPLAGGDDSDGIDLRCAPLASATACAKAPEPMFACLVDDRREMGNGGGTEVFGLFIIRASPAVALPGLANFLEERSEAARNMNERELNDAPERFDAGLYFDLGLTDECWPHQHPEACERFVARDTTRAPPKLVFTDGCAGRIGFVWSSEGLEATVPERPAPAAPERDAGP